MAQTLAEKVNQLKCDVVTAARLVEFWNKQIEVYGEFKAESFYKHLGFNHIQLKGFEWEGLRLSREPKEHEKFAVKGIADTQESARDKIKVILLKLRKKLISDGLKGIKKLTPETYHELALQAPAEIRNELRDRLIKIHKQARLLVVSELGKKDDPEDDGFDDVDTYTDVTDSQTANDVQRRLVDSASKFTLLGLTGSVLWNAVQSEMEAGSVSYIDRSSAGLANKVIGIGRGDEMRSRSDQIDRYEYSALLDVNTCDPCAELDGTTASSMDELPDVPLAECLGGPLCRCFIVAIAL